MIYVPQVTTPQGHAFVLHSVQLRSKYAQKMRAPNNALQSSIHARKCTKRSVWQSICLLFIVFLYSDLTDVSIQKSVCKSVWLRLNRKQILGNQNKIDKKQPMESVFSNFGNQPLWNSHSLLSLPYSQTCPELVQGCYENYKVRQRTTMCRDN